MAHHILHTAELLLTDVDAPLLRDAAVLLDEDSRVVEVGPPAQISTGYEQRVDHLLLMPGVINCHVHLTDAGIEEPIGGGAGLIAWVGDLLAHRAARGADRETAMRAVEDVLARMSEGGTVAVGEVCNDFSTLEPIVRSGIRCRFIHELLAFKEGLAQIAITLGLKDKRIAELPSTVRYALGAHAPYSVSPALMERIAERDRQIDAFLYQHLAEDPAERELYLNGAGPWRDVLQRLEAWDEGWEAKGVSPIEFYDRLGLLNDRFVAVHLADATDQEIELLARRGVRAILSPRSNLHITGRLPSMAAIASSGMAIGFGTDGRGSSPSVDVFDEARLLMERFPELPSGMLLRGLTTGGAGILGFDDLGAIRPGTAPGLVAVETEVRSTDLGSIERAIVLEASARRRVG